MLDNRLQVTLFKDALYFLKWILGGGQEELLEDGTCLNFQKFPLCNKCQDLQKSSKKSNMTAVNLCHEKSQNLESSTAGAPLQTLWKTSMSVLLVMALLGSRLSDEDFEVRRGVFGGS